MSRLARSTSLYDAMRACMTENRRPRASEIEAVARKIWSDTHCTIDESAWLALDAESFTYRQAIAAARAALEPADLPLEMLVEAA